MQADPVKSGEGERVAVAIGVKSDCLVEELKEVALGGG